MGRGLGCYESVAELEEWELHSLQHVEHVVGTPHHLLNVWQGKDVETEHVVEVQGNCTQAKGSREE